MEGPILAQGTSVLIAGVESGLSTHWQDSIVLGWDHPECRELAALLVDGVRSWEAAVGRAPAELAVACWANLFRGGETLGIHGHGMYLLGHFTVESGYADGQFGAALAGNTVYYEPNSLYCRVPLVNPHRRILPPRPGQLTICSGHVHHEVLPYDGAGQRITIAMDVVELDRTAGSFEEPRWLRLPRS